MSQQLIPINGGVVQEVQTSTTQNPLQVLSQQYIQVKGLEERPTEWVPAGRPIYRRLPGVSETYQIDFFNVVPAPNTAAAAEIQDIGYVYVPFEGSIYGSESLEVKAAPTKKALLIQAGEIVWKYGKMSVLPTIVDLEVLDILSGQYEVAYQLIYDDSPIPKLYAVEDFALNGIPLNISSSADSVVGWRYPAVNAFLNTSSNWWSNQDSYFPAFAQPTSSFLQWESELTMAYSKIVLRCPANTAYTGTATLNYVSGTTLVPVETVSIQADSVGQYFEFSLQSPSYQSGWNVTFSSLDVAIQSIEVSGVLTLLEPQAELSTRAVLVMYPTGSLPRTVVLNNGKTVEASYCHLAIVDIKTFEVDKLRDTRYVIHRDYVPVADWLTKPFDDDLVNLYEQVSDYSDLWLAPPSCMKQEYASLLENQIVIEK